MSDKETQRQYELALEGLADNEYFYPQNFEIREKIESMLFASSRRIRELMAVEVNFNRLNDILREAILIQLYLKLKEAKVNIVIEKEDLRREVSVYLGERDFSVDLLESEDGRHMFDQELFKARNCVLKLAWGLDPDDLLDSLIDISE